MIGPDNKKLVADAIRKLGGSHASVRDHDVKAWASITFAGARHRMKVRFEGEAAMESGELFVAFLPDHEFDLQGHLVADVAVTNVDYVIGSHLAADIELLVIEGRA